MDNLQGGKRVAEEKTVKASGTKAPRLTEASKAAG
jgi:hypothetical protein